MIEDIALGAFCIMANAHHHPYKVFLAEGNIPRAGRVNDVVGNVVNIAYSSKSISYLEHQKYS